MQDYRIGIFGEVIWNKGGWERHYLPSRLSIKRAVKDGVPIDYFTYQKGNSVSYDERLVKSWQNEVNQILHEKNAVCFSEESSLLGTLLYEGDYMPFLSRMNSQEHESHISLRRGKGKIFVNNRNKTKELTNRKNMLVQWLKETNDAGSIFAFDWRSDLKESRA